MHANDAVYQLGRRWNWDKVGIGLSALCMVHCLVSPFLLLLLPTVGTLYASGAEQFHWLMAIVVLPVALFAFVRGFRHHRRAMTLVLGLAGVACLYAALAFHELFASDLPHTLFTLAGSVLLLVGHVMNWRYCARCDHAH